MYAYAYEKYVMVNTKNLAMAGNFFQKHWRGKS